VWTPREIVAIAAAHPPTFAPGTGWSYSDTNYFVLGVIVDAATGNSLAGELHRRIFAQLRLRATSLPTGPGIAGRHAHGYFLRPLEDVTVGSPSVQWAAGTLVSNADEPRPLLPRPPRRTPPSPRRPAAYEDDGGGATARASQRLRTRACRESPRRAGRCGATPAAAPGMWPTPQQQEQAPGRRSRHATGALSAAGLFGLPTRVARAVDRLIDGAYCH
jgi:CubicO group peptidase (beta-lactamase class C family)